MSAGLRRMLFVAAFITVIVCAPSPAAELDLDAVLEPVIALEARIPGDARSARTLGTVRGGTGVIIDGAGLVLTIGYLIMEADEVDLIPNGLGGKRIPADVVAWDQETGIGLVRSRQPLGIAPMPLGDSSPLRAGDAVITASWERLKGLVPAVVVQRRIYAAYWEYMLEDALYVAPIHPGFPGAALIDLKGRLAGIGGFALTDEVDEDEVVGTIFVPIDVLKPVLADLLLDGRSPARRPWLGLYCEEIEGGLRVWRVPEHGPASLAGVKTGDLVRSVNARPVKTLEGLYRALWSSVRPGESVNLELEREGKRIDLDLTSIDRYTLLRHNHSTW